MASTIKTTLVWNKGAIKSAERDLAAGLINLAEAVAAAEGRKAPVDTSALVGSIRVEKKSENKVEVVAGGTAKGYNVPYAFRRNFENNLHPSTRHFAEHGLEEVVRGGIGQYFRIGGRV